MRAALFATADPSSSVVAAADMVGVGLRAVAPVTGSVDEALAAGVALADDEVDSGTDLLVVACPGQGSAAAVLVSVLADTEPVKVLPRGTHIDPEDWMAMAIAVRDARRRAVPVRHRPAEVLDAVGSPDLAAAAGCLLRAAVRRTPVLLDGAGALAAAVVAYEAQPRAVRWWRAADRSPHNAHRIAVTKLGLSPILDLDTWAEDGTAGLLAVPLLRAAARALTPSADV
jgi:nicotinate-nucleotide--dimethylbenzimidazole phosphoribosyltransferase